MRASGAVPRDGAEYAVSPAQAELQERLARALARGAVIVFDYGESGPDRYERPVPRLRTYLGGMAGGDPLAAPGTQDITADVDFGAVRAAGERAGLARRSTPRSRSGCSLTARPMRSPRCRATTPSGCGSRRSATRAAAARRSASWCRSATDAAA